MASDKVISLSQFVKDQKKREALTQPGDEALSKQLTINKTLAEKREQERLRQNKLVLRSYRIKKK